MQLFRYALNCHEGVITKNFESVWLLSFDFLFAFALLYVCITVLHIV